MVDHVCEPISSTGLASSQLRRKPQDEVKTSLTAYLTDVIIKIVNGHPNSRIDELLPWAYAVNQPLKDVA
jgi:hypothetical protein